MQGLLAVVYKQSRRLANPFDTLENHFGTSGTPWSTPLAIWDRPAEPWKQQDQHEVVLTRMCIDLGLIWGSYFEFVGHRGLQFTFLSTLGDPNSWLSHQTTICTEILFYKPWERLLLSAALKTDSKIGSFSCILGEAPGSQDH